MADRADKIARVVVFQVGVENHDVGRFPPFLKQDAQVLHVGNIDDAGKALGLQQGFQRDPDRQITFAHQNYDPGPVCFRDHPLIQCRTER